MSGKTAKKLRNMVVIAGTPKGHPDFKQKYKGLKKDFKSWGRAQKEEFLSLVSAAIKEHKAQAKKETT